MCEGGVIVLGINVGVMGMFLDLCTPIWHASELRREKVIVSEFATRLLLDFHTYFIELRGSQITLIAKCQILTNLL